MDPTALRLIPPLPGTERVRRQWVLSSRLREVGPAVDALVRAAASALTVRGSVASDALWEDLRIGVSEAATNSVLHAYDGRPGQPLCLELAGNERRVVAALADRGHPPPRHLIDARPPAMPAPDGLPEGGWGWPLIRMISDRVTLCRRDGWNVLLLERDLDR